jgi:hypothetical protein
LRSRHLDCSPQSYAWLSDGKLCFLNMADRELVRLNSQLVPRSPWFLD